ncbi:MAG: hypothetical protein WBL35_06440 [Ornithinibacter sp.]
MLDDPVDELDGEPPVDPEDDPEPVESDPFEPDPFEPDPFESEAAESDPADPEDSLEPLASPDEEEPELLRPSLRESVR